MRQAAASTVGVTCLLAFACAKGAPPGSGPADGGTTVSSSSGGAASSGSGSSGEGGSPSSTAAGDAGSEDDAMSPCPFDAGGLITSLAASDAGPLSWLVCGQNGCPSEFAACVKDACCNAIVYSALTCVESGGGESTASERTTTLLTCFERGLSWNNANVSPLLTCLEDVEPTCSSEDTGDASTSAGTIGSLCAAAIAADCGTSYQSLYIECVPRLGEVASCPALQTCLACAGSAPTVTCSDAGSPVVAGCACALDTCLGSDDAGAGTPDAACGSQNVMQTSTSNTDATAVQVVPYSPGSVLVLRGPSLDGGSTGELSGTFEVTGLPPNGGVSVEVVTGNCATTGCPDDLVFNVGAPDAASPVAVPSFVPWVGCGVGAVGTDGTNDLVVSVSKTGDGGDDQGVGLKLTPLPGGAEF
jgi:hypothetical protein